MAVVIGTNAGFCTVTPTANPDGTIDAGWDGYLFAARFTSPSGSNRATRLWLWLDGSTGSVDWQGAIYSNDAAPTPDEPNVAISPGIYTGIKLPANSAGEWLSTPVSIPLTASTLYWIAIGIPTAVGSVDFDRALTGSGGDIASWAADAAGTLDATWGTVGGSYEDGRIFAIGATYESVASGALTGTATASITESDITAGGKTVIITLTNDNFIA